MLIALALTYLLPILLLLVLPVGLVIALCSWSQALNWEASFILASYVAFLGYVRIQDLLSPPLPLPAYLFWTLKVLAILSPTCIGVAWLRWSGVKWWLALLLFFFVPFGMLEIYFISTFPRG